MCGVFSKGPARCAQLTPTVAMVTSATIVLEPIPLKETGNIHHLKSEFDIFPLEQDGDFFYT